MIRTIAATTFSRFGVVLVSFGVLISTNQVLGPEGKGFTSLFLLNVTLIQLVSSFIGGPALVYLLPRLGIERLLIPSYGWTFITALSIPFLLHLFGLQPSEHLYDLIFIGGLHAAGQIHMQLLLGEEKIKEHNWISFGQAFFLLASLWFFFEILDIRDISAYIGALYISYLFTLVASFLKIYSSIGTTPESELKGTWTITIRSLINHGAWIQLANVSQLLNYRLSYYLIEKLIPVNSMDSLGYYSTAINLAEACWVVSKAMAMVQYSKLSNTSNPIEIRRISVQMWKLSFYSGLFLITPLLLIPPSFWDFLFGVGQGFGQIRVLLLILAPGILFMSLSNSMSAHFAGQALYKVNARVSAFGLLSTLVLSPLLIHHFGLIGAAWATSISFVLASVYQTYLFIEKGRIPLSDLLPSRADGLLFTNALKAFLGKK